MTFCAVAALLVLGASSLAAQVTVVVPNASATASGATGLNTPIRNAARQVQIFVHRSQLSGLSTGSAVSALSFRLDEATATNWPSQGLNYTDYTIRLSQSDAASFAAGELGSTTLATNIGAGVTTVRTGALSIPANAFTMGNPAPFTYVITFTTNYVYTSGTDIVVTIAHTGYLPATETQVFADSTPYVANTCDCLIETTGTGTTGTFSDVPVVRLTYTDGDPEVDVRKTVAGASTQDGGTMRHTTPLVAASTTNAVSFFIVNQGATQNLTISAFSAVGTGCTVTTTTPPPATIAPAASAQVALNVNVATVTSHASWSIAVSFNNNDTTGSESPYNFTILGSVGMAGTFTVNATGGQFTDLGLAFDALENFGVAAPVVFNLTGNFTSGINYELGSDNGVIEPVYGTSSTNTITVQAAAGQSPVISGSGAIIGASLGGFTGDCTIILTDVGFITLQGLDLDSGGLAATSDSSILVWHDASYTYATAPVIVSRCKLHNASGGGGFTGIGNNTTNGLENVTVENCLLWDFGLTAGTFAGLLEGAISMFRPFSNSFVRHNTILLTGTHFPATTGCCFQNFGNGSLLGDFSYNVCYTPITNGICVDFAGTIGGGTTPMVPVASNRNVFYYPAGTFSPHDTSLTNWQTLRSRDGNSLNADPLLAQAATTPFDLHINAGSPAINLATTSTSTIDIDGDARTAGQADAGADERTGAAATPSLTIVATDSAAAEATPATATGTYTITASSAPATALTVNFTMSGTAAVASGTDYALSGSSVAYTTGPNGTFTFPAGVTTTTITLTPVDDVAAESSETAIMTLTANTGYTVGAPAAGTVNIADNDTVGTPAVTVNATDSAAAEATPATQTGTFTITLSPVSASSVTISFTMSGTASTTPGTDYSLSGTGVTWTGPGGTIVVPASTASVTVTLTPVDDVAVESSETAIMTVNAGAGYTVGAPASGTVNIADNDSTPPALTIVTSTLPNGTVGTAYNGTITAQNGTGPYTWSLASGTLPAGLTLNTAATGLTTSITGTPTTAGAATFTIQITDSAAGSDTQLFNVTINPVGTGGGIGGGGGGGGGCVADASVSNWYLLAALGGIMLLAAARRRRTA